MQAVVYERYGPPSVLHLAEVEQPVPKADEVLVRVHAATVTRTDCAVRAGKGFITRLGYSIVTTGRPFKAIWRPVRRILGMEFAGEVAATGADVTDFAVGDRIFGVNPGNFGAHAEYLCLGRRAPLARMAAGMTFEQAAAVCDGALLALGCLRKAKLQAGQRILIYGASGSIGTAGVQLAKHAIGAHVTGVCSAKNLDIVRGLGADEVIDYRRDDFTRNGQTYDVILDAAGKLTFPRCRRSLTPHGIFVPTDGGANLFWALRTARSKGKRVVSDVPPHYRQQDVVYLKELIEAGKYRAVIDRVCPLDQVVAATAYVETEQKTGNVVLTVGAEAGAS